MGFWNQGFENETRSAFSSPIAGVSHGDTVVIEGPGQQGLAGVIVAKEAGAEKIIVTGMTKDRA
jgi:threonine dehydrogenase-like Zn-dependent dehydrogenase